MRKFAQTGGFKMNFYAGSPRTSGPARKIRGGGDIMNHLIRPNSVCRHASLGQAIVDTIGNTNTTNTLIRNASGQRVMVLTTDLQPYSLRIGKDSGVRSQWRDAFGQIRSERRYIDDNPVCVRYKHTAAGGELECWDDTSIHNDDCPDNRALVDMGSNAAENPMLDRRDPGGTRSMNAADMRERCVQYGNRMFALYEKRAIDFQPPWFRNFEKISKLLEIPADLSHRLCRAIKALEFNREMARKLFFGHTTIGGEGRTGLISRAGQSDEIAKLVEVLENLNDAANKIELDEGASPLEFDAFYDPRMIYALDQDQNEDDGLDETVISPEFGAFPLSDGTDGVDYALIDEIKGADATKIREIQSRMFPTENRYYGTVRRAEYHWMNSAQKSIVWAFIKDRKARLEHKALRSLSGDAGKVAKLVRELGRTPQARALIACWMNGKPFNMCGVQMSFAQPSQEQIAGVWAIYKTLK
jgi:hypothetical protein